jgi:hypothetical protein
MRCILKIAKGVCGKYVLHYKLDASIVFSKIKNKLVTDGADVLSTSLSISLRKLNEAKSTWLRTRLLENQVSIPGRG